MRTVVDCVLAGAGIGIAVWRLAPTLAAVGDVAVGFAGLRWVWVAVACAAATASLVSYGQLQRLVLACGGARLPVTAVQAVNFVGNALAQTLPSAGAAAGAAYTAAALHRRGVDTTLAVWSATFTALVSAAGLVVIAPLLLAADGLLPLSVGVALAGVLALLCRAAWLVLSRPVPLHWLVWHTLAIAGRLPVVRRASWVGHRPATVVDAVTRRLAGLRPSPAQWWRITGVALGSWGLDYAALAACVAATGDVVPWAALAAGYLAVQSSIALQLTPAGTGPAEAGLLAALTAGGEQAAHAAMAVVAYRGITWLGLASAGWLVFVVVERGRHRRARVAVRT